MDEFQNHMMKALEGDQYSMWHVAYDYLVGKGVEQNIEEGEKWYKKLVELGNEEASIDYSKMCFYGNVLPKDTRKAVDILKKYLDNGCYKSQEWYAEILDSEEFRQYEEAFEMMKKSASQGYEDAMINLGVMYKFGHGTPRNTGMALQYLKPIADKNIPYAAFHVAEIYHEANDMEKAIQYYSIASVENPVAQYRLGVFNLKGDTLPQNIERALDYFNRAAAQNFAEAQGALGEIYQTNEYALGNGKQAEYWFEQAINNGLWQVYHNLGNMYMNGEVIGKDVNKAIYYYKKAAENGSQESQRWLALLYREGKEIPENPSESFYWEKLAVENGREKSKTNLALYYLNGYGTETDVEQGLHLMIEAAESGNSEAQYNLGNFYRLGEFVGQDYVKAIHWYTLAANQGDAVAMNNLAWIYQNVYNDMDKAFEYYFKSAELGDMMAQFNLALMYKRGDGISVNINECKRLLTGLADYGDDDACVELGVLYEDGLLGAPDYGQAAEWYKKAITKNNARAMAYLAIMILNKYIPGDTDNAKQLLIKSKSLGYEGAEDAYTHFFNDIV